MKVIWNNEYIKYKYSKNEPYYIKDYFIICTNQSINGSIFPIKKSISNFKILDHEYILINGKFNVGDKLFADGIEYIFSENQLVNSKSIKNEETNKEKLIESNTDIISFKILKIINDENKIYIHSEEITKEQLTIIINEYTNEIYPEFPFNTIKKKIEIINNRNYIHEIKKGTITVISINDNNGNLIELEYENTPLYHFSTVKSLKEKINDLNLNINLKEDEYYKKLISEKSIMLKKSFGLTEEEYKNIELFPIFKELVNLYCIKSIMSFGYINGSSIMPGNNYENTDMTLGKFKTGGENNEGTIFSHDAIQNIIKVNEQKLYNSIFNKSIKVKKDKISSNIKPIIIPEYFQIKCKILRRKFNEFL